MKLHELYMPGDIGCPYFALVLPGAHYELNISNLTLTDRDCEHDAIRIVRPGMYGFHSKDKLAKFVRRINAGEEIELAHAFIAKK